MVMDIDTKMEAGDRIQVGWINWREMSGVLSDKGISKLKGYKVCRTVMRPARLQAKETVVFKITNFTWMEGVAMRMLKWMCGVTQKDHLQNEYIRETLKVTNVSSKIQEGKLRWFGYIETMNNTWEESG